jgi:hypothetical protein
MRPAYRRLCTLFAFFALGAGASSQGVAIPYAESFEGPVWPGPEWAIAVSNPAFGRIQAVTPSPLSPDGALAANFDVSASPNESINDLTLTVNLAAAPAAVLTYWAKETADETHPEDGLFLNDGIGASWFKAVDHATLTGSWTQVTVNLAAVATGSGLAITPGFKIRFSQRDNFPTPTDGLQIDGVLIAAPPSGQANSANAYLDVNGGQNSLGQTAAIGVPGTFTALAAPGTLLTLTVQGAPNQPYAIAIGPLHANNASFPGLGSLDIGAMGGGNLSDVQIVIDGNAPGFLNALAQTGPTGSSVLTFTIPALPPGPWTAFQAGVFNGPVFTLTAATGITVP